MEYYSTLAKRRRLEGGSAPSTAAVSDSAITISPDDQNQEITVHAPSSNNNYDVINTLHHTHNTSYSEDDDDDDSDDEILGQMIYQSSRTAQLLREQAAVEEAKKIGADAVSGRSELQHHPKMNDRIEAVSLQIITERKVLPAERVLDESAQREHQITRSKRDTTDAAKNKHHFETKRVIKSFTQRLEDLRAYKEKHGHTNVKQRDDRSLYQFFVGIRKARKHPEKSTVTLTDVRIASLNALGFDWSIKGHVVKKSFEQRIEDLRAYKEKHGHVNVKQSEDKSLNDFCSTIRRTRNNPEKYNMLINEERIASLNALGFDWAVNNQRVGEKRKSFKQRVEDLQSYKEKHGHVNVKRSDDKSLYKFCIDMRYARNNPEKSTTFINEERTVSLDALGFDWSANLNAEKSDKLLGVFEVPKEDNVSYNCSTFPHINVAILTICFY